MKIGSWVKRTGTKGNPDNERQFSEVMPLTRMIGQPQNCKRCS